MEALLIAPGAPAEALIGALATRGWGFQVARDAAVNPAQSVSAVVWSGPATAGAIKAARQAHPAAYLVACCEPTAAADAIEAGADDWWSSGAPASEIGARLALAERRLLQRATLRSADALHRDIVDSANDIIYTHDLAGVFTSVNVAGTAILGWPLEELIGKRIADIVAPDHLTRAQEATARKVTSGGPTIYEIDVVTKAGNRVPLEVSTRLTFEDDRPTGVLGIARDITARRAAQRLVDSQAALFEGIARGDALEVTLAEVCRLIEHECPGTTCAVKLLEPDAQALRLAAAPSLDEDYAQRMATMPVGPSAAACGTAAYRGERVICPDLTTDPLWEGFREEALAQGFRACWSSPLRSTSGGTLGTFGVYRGTPGPPSEDELRAVGRATHIAGIAIERARAAETLRRTEELLRQVVSNAPLILLALDEDGVFTFSHGAGLKQLNIQPGEAVGRSFFERYPDPNLHSQVRLALAGGTGQAEVEIGGYWWDARYVPARDASGDVVGAIGVVIDVSERRQIEAALRESEANYRAVLQGTSDAIWALDRGADGQWRVAFANAAFRELTGVLPEAAVGRTVHEFMPPHWAAQALARYEQAEQAGETIRYDEVLEFRNPPRWIVTSLRPLYDDAGRCYRLVGSTRDVTERRQAEEAMRLAQARLETVVSSAPVIVFSVDSEGIFTLSEGKGLETVGLQAGQMVGSSIFEVYPGSPELLAEVRRALEGQQEPGKAFEFSRGEFVYEMSLQTLRDEDDRVTGIAGVALDVSERKRAERALFQAQKLESLGVLAGGIAHDFNNLLVGILGNAGLALRDVPEGSPARESLEDIEAAAQRAADLARQMLAYSGRGRFVVKPLDLNDLVGEMAQLLRVSIGKGVRLEQHLDQGRPVVEADATQISQVVMNLVINASDAIGEREGVVRVSTGVVHATPALLADTYLAPDLPAGNYAIITVSDNGEGMDAATRARIFDPFFTTKFTGRGLGLAAVLGIVRGHHGAIHVESEPGRGSTFQVLLPLAGEGAMPATGTPARAEWRGSGAVLVVDDEETVRRVTARVLASQGFEVVTAAGGPEAIAAWKARPEGFDLMLLDLTMPGMSGDETYRSIRKLQSQARVVLMSGYSEQDATQRFGSEGLVGFIQKPYELGELQRVIRAALER